MAWLSMKLDPTDPKTWLARARSNLRRAELGRQHPDILFEDLCFESEQAVEKALKSVCVHLGIEFPKTHSLVYLMDLIERAGLSIPEGIKKADVLTRYAVAARYPGLEEEVDVAEYVRAVDLARRVVKWAEKVIKKGKT